MCTIFAGKQNEQRHDKSNKMSVRPAKTQLNLGIRPVWSESSLCAQWVAKDPIFLHADSEDFDQTGHTHFVGFVMSWLKCNIEQKMLTGGNNLRIVDVFLNLERAYVLSQYEVIYLDFVGTPGPSNISHMRVSFITRITAAWFWLCLRAFTCLPLCISREPQGCIVVTLYQCFFFRNDSTNGASD